MKNFLLSIKKYSILVIIITLVLGVLLVAFPERMLTYVAYILGGGIILCGLVAIINTVIKKGSNLSIVCGAIAVLFGVLICAFHTQIMNAVVFILGICLLVGGVVDLLNSVEIAIAKHRSWILTVVMSIASIVIGILSIVNPFDTRTKVVVLVGIGFILFALLEIASYVQIQMVANRHIDTEKMKEDSEKATEVEFEDVESN